MRVEDLHHDELLELDAEGGVVRFAGQRALLVDAIAMGLLRKHLVENFGLTAARAVLTQFGFAHGWRMAEAMQSEFDWADEREWLRAGPRIYNLEGLFRVQPGSEDPLTKKGAMLLASYEAEQHVLHFGRSDSAVCWTICGLMSGYVSRIVGEEIYVLEDRCMGRGRCRLQPLGTHSRRMGRRARRRSRVLRGGETAGKPRRLLASGDRESEGGRAKTSRAPSLPQPRGAKRRTTRRARRMQSSNAASR